MLLTIRKFIVLFTCLLGDILCNQEGLQSVDTFVDKIIDFNEDDSGRYNSIDKENNVTSNHKDIFIKGTVVRRTLLYLGMFLCIFFLFQFCRKLIYIYKKTRQLQSIPKDSIFGILPKMLNLEAEGIYNLVVELLDSCMDEIIKNPVKLWFGPQLSVIIGKPEHIQTVLTSPHTMEKSRYFYIGFKDVFGEQSYLYQPVSMWKPHRKMYQTHLTNIKVFNNLDRLQSICDEFIEEKHSQLLQPDISFKEISQLLHIMLSKCICNFLMGSNPTDYNLIIQFINGLHTIHDMAYQRALKSWLHNDFIYKLSSQYKQQKKSLEQCDVFTNWYIENRIEQRALMKKKRNDFTDETKIDKCLLDTFLDLMESGEMTMKEVREECYLFFSASIDTSVYTLHLAITMIAMYPEIQQKLQEEIQQVFGDSDRSAEAEDIKQMKYLEMIIKETMRYYPPAPVMGREVTKDIEIDNCTIPAGCIFIPAPYSVHHNPAIYPEPKKFDPERFRSENKRHPYSFIPFSGGPRNCIGYYFANFIMKLSLLKIVRRYKLSTKCTHSDIKSKLLITATLKYAKPVVFEPRLS